MRPYKGRRAEAGLWCLFGAEESETFEEKYTHRGIMLLILAFIFLPMAGVMVKDPTLGIVLFIAPFFGLALWLGIGSRMFNRGEQKPKELNDVGRGVEHSAAGVLPAGVRDPRPGHGTY